MVCVSCWRESDEWLKVGGDVLKNLDVSTSFHLSDREEVCENTAYSEGINRERDVREIDRGSVGACVSMTSSVPIASG